MRYLRRLSLTAGGLFPVLLATAGFAAADETPPTFAKDIAPVIFRNCASCHRPGQAAPFSLLSYADVKKRGDLIVALTASRQMPPWKPGVGDYPLRDDLRLDDATIAIVKRWVAAGMPEGDAASTPAPPQFATGWTLGEPDLVLTMSEAFRVPAEGADIYRNFVLPTNLTEDRWVKAIDFRPSARTVVHHSLFFMDSRGAARKLDEEDPQPGFPGGMGAISRLRQGARGAGQDNAGRSGGGGPDGGRGFGGLGGWALGAQPRALPEGLAFFLPAGADLILATHFHPSGKTEEEKSTIGLYFADTPPRQRFTGIQLPPVFGAFAGIDIPADSNDFVIEDSFELPVDVRSFGVSAHAHYLGKTLTLTATFPSGETKTLFSIPDWDFAWQGQYRYQEFVPLPKGTRLHSRITYDNSADNLRNPRVPPQRVRFGEQSTDEMGSITLLVVAAKEEELPQLQNMYRDHIRQMAIGVAGLKALQGRFRAP